MIAQDSGIYGMTFSKIKNLTSKILYRKYRKSLLLYNLTPSNFWFEGVSLRPWVIFAKRFTKIHCFVIWFLIAIWWNLPYFLNNASETWGRWNKCFLFCRYGIFNCLLHSSLTRKYRNENLQSNFIKITLWYGLFTLNLLDIFRTFFLKNTPGWVVLYWTCSKLNCCFLAFLDIYNDRYNFTIGKSATCFILIYVMLVKNKPRNCELFNVSHHFLYKMCWLGGWLPKIIVLLSWIISPQIGIGNL